MMSKYMLGVLAVVGCLHMVSGDGLPEYRLPGDVKPYHYHLTLITYIDEAANFTYDGKVTIDLHVLNETNRLVLHSKDLAIEDMKLNFPDNKYNVSVTNITYNIPLEFIILQLSEPLKQDTNLSVTLSFKGRLLDDLVGFYRSSYIDSHTGKKVWLATTQFESTYARRAFPCFDEPAYKATFTISLGREKRHTAISNMPLAKSTPMPDKEDWFLDEFEKSVPMSTYLVAFIISDFQYVESPKYKNNVVFKIWARAEAINQTDYASYLGPRVLSFFEEYYDVPYPLPKQDMVAVPDFSAGAMENWGIITYRERDLLYSPITSTSQAKERVGHVIAHELAHQWFGNLVTMKWWTDLWLNEGFATFMSVQALDRVHPDWNALREESVDNLGDVFKLDALDTSHPVSVPIGDPNEIDQIFDVISYKKGSVVIRMMSLFLGNEAFKAGISSYLKKYRFQNAEQDDLWQSLTESAHKLGSLPKKYNVKEIMDSWTKQTGFPLVTVVRDYDNQTATVSQARYYYKTKNPKSLEQVWWVPLSYSSSGVSTRSSTPSDWLSGSTSTVINNMPTKDKWVLFNVDMAALYRVNYDSHNWDLLSMALTQENHSDISDLNRFQLIIDSMALSSIGKLPYKTSLRLLQYLNNENEYIPWKAAFSCLTRIQTILKKSPEYGIFRDYVKTLITPRYIKIGGLNANLTDKLDVVKQSIDIISWSCKMEVENCTEGAIALYKDWMNTDDPDFNNPIPKDLRTIVYCTAISRGGVKEWEFLWQRYKNANVANAKSIMLKALGCTTRIWLLNRMLEESINKDGVIRKQDATAAFTFVATSGIGYIVAKDFLYTRTGDIAEYLKAQLTTLSRYATTIANGITTEKELNEFSAWVDNNSATLKESSLSVKQGKETARTNVDWVANQKANIVNALKELMA